nr:MAG TPA: hypothetical protein [Caudoviricetes sp.]
MSAASRWFTDINHPIQPIGLAFCGRDLHIQISGVQP